MRWLRTFSLISRFEGANIKFCKEIKWDGYRLPVNEKCTIGWGNPAKKYYIVGQTDNMAISENRANAVVNALVSKHAVNAEQLSAHGVEFLSPTATNSPAEGKAKNCRVEIVEQ